MLGGSDTCVGTVVPTLRYRDVAAAVDWLCAAFGFQPNVVLRTEDGSVGYAELMFGEGMIMLGPSEGSAIGDLKTQREPVGGSETQICYLSVADAAAHCARAKAAGATIVLDVEDEICRGRGYSCRDLEGHIWNFGTYNPWRHEPEAANGEGGFGPGFTAALRRVALGVGFVAITFAAAVGVAAGLEMADPGAATAGRRLEGEARAQPERHEGRLGAASDPLLIKVREQLAKERLARQGAEQLL